ncbi:MAG TPA: Ig-like domain-containing protein, partial [Polyangia bacterium]
IRPTSVPIPTASITAPVDGDRLTAPASVTIAVNAGGTNPITKVEFFSNDVKLGEDSVAPFEWALSDLGQGLYRFTARATNNVGGSKLADAVTITVNGPNAIIDAPAEGSTFIAGNPVTFSGSATDPEDGPLATSRLEWNVMLHHNSHVHPAAGPFVGVASGSFTPDPDDEVDHDVWYGIYLTATDSAGIKHTTRRDVLPLKSTLSLVSNPAGLKIDLDNSPQVTPFSFLGVAGVHRLLGASYYQVMSGTGATGGNFYTFSGWSDGATRIRTITTPTSSTTYTANYNPVSWSNAAIGGATAGSLAVASGVFTQRGSGADIEGTSDAFQYAYQNVAGDVSVTARLDSLQNTNTWAKSGVMLRNGTAANAANVMAFLTPTATNKFRFQYRSTAGGTTTSLASTPNSAIPAYVRLTRVGNVFTAFYSTDGNSFTQIGTPQTITMAETIQAGLATTSHVNGTLATATFSNVALTGAGPAAPTIPVAPSGLSATGGTGQASLTWVDNANNETGFRIERKVSTDPDTAFAEVGTAASNATTFTNTTVAAGTYSYRVRAYNAVGNSNPSNSANATVTAPPQPPAAPSGLVATGGAGQATLNWVDNASNETGFKIERKLSSQADTSFAQIATVGAGIATYTNTSVAAGTYSYRVRANNAAGDSAYSNVATATVTTPPVTWTSQDIGAVAATGSHTESNGTFTVNGSGADIQGTADEFRFVYRSITSNTVTITARVMSLSNTHAYAKAGVMIRNGTAANAANVVMLTTPTSANGYHTQRRTSAGGTTTTARSTPNGTAPVWVRVVRNGNTFSTFYSTSTSATPPTTWTAVGTSQSITMGATVQVGMAVTSHSDGILAGGVFSGVTITTP